MPDFVDERCRDAGHGEEDGNSSEQQEALHEPSLPCPGIGDLTRRSHRRTGVRASIPAVNHTPRYAADLTLYTELIAGAASPAEGISSRWRDRQVTRDPGASSVARGGRQSILSSAQSVKTGLPDYLAALSVPGGNAR